MLAAQGEDRGPGFYLAALERAQGLWQIGEPAQAILRLNRAWSADLRGGEQVLREWPSPFVALRWILENAPADRFLGNPVRHFQHLATRMNEVRRETRIWRAWGCFHLAERVLAAPRDVKQIEREAVVIPTLAQVEDALGRVGWIGEAAQLRHAFDFATS